jgi:ankyrin repeat protein
LVDLFIKHDKKDQLTFKINHSFYGGNVNNLYLSINGNCREQYGVAIKLIKYFIKEKMTEELIVSDQMKLTLLIHVLHAQLYDEANDLIDYFIENDKEQLTKFDVRGYTVLIHAIASGDERKKPEKEKVILKLIDYFVENDKDQLTKNINGVSVLKEATDNKLSKVIDTLIKYYTENNMISVLQNTDQKIVQKHLPQSGGKPQIKMYQKRNKNRKHNHSKKCKHIKTKNTKSMKRRRITKKTI